MTLTIGIISVLLSILTALYLQIPTFILGLGYGWSHNYPTKRWILRIVALLAFSFFVTQTSSIGLIIGIGLPFFFFLVFSLFNANPNLFIALDEKDIVKQREKKYTDQTEIVGYIDNQGNTICYPVKEMVMPRHILNDTFEQNPLLITYCAACRSTMIYNPVIDNLRLNFEVVGVRRRNMVIRDKETGTIWQQGTGEAMFGKLKGKRLDFYPYQQMNLSDWLQQYPNSVIAQESSEVRKGFLPKEKLMKVLEKVTGKFVAPGKTDLNGLPLREKIWGLEIDGKHKAYPISELKNVERFTDKVGETEIEIEYNPKSGQISGRTITTGTELKFQNHWWFGWKEFHPETEIWKK